MLTRVKGTHDFLDLTLLNAFLEITKKHLSAYHFTEIATPILEPTELFHRSLGLETDVVSKEMYILPSRTAEDESICLRPEVTASIMRAFLNNNVAQTPWKVFTWGPMFRYERPQKGRFRQFHQVSMEIIGSASIAQDAYFITMLDRLFTEKLKLSTYGLLINFMGCSNDRQEFKKALGIFLEAHKTEICATCLVRKDKNSLRVFDCKNPVCKELYTKAPVITDSLCTDCVMEWQQLQLLLAQLSVSYSHAPTLVRGLDYYSKTVFEFVSIDLGAQNTFCGGGRYNSLAKELGAAEDQPSIGAAIGIERILMMLETSASLVLPQPPRLQIIIPLSDAQTALALQLADTLHAQGLTTEVLVDNNSLKSKMRHANKLGARFVIMIGSDEQAAGTAMVKDMVIGTEIALKQTEVATYLAITKEPVA